MDLYNIVYKKFYHKLVLEGLLNALMWALSGSLIVAFIISLVGVIIDSNLLLISLLVFLILSIVGTLILYFIKYKPNELDVARRVDLEGLKERLVTMVENKDNDSIMAKLQREDALSKLVEVQNTKIKFNISKKHSLICGCIIVLSIISETLFGLVSYGVIGNENKETQIMYELRYIETNGGIIMGEKHQELKANANASEVLAVADNGYMFLGWSDGLLSPKRIDLNVNSNISVKALFMDLSKELASGSTFDKDAPGIKDNISDDKLDGPGNMPNASGEYIEANQVIDGNTYYRDVYEDYLIEALKILNSGEEIPDYLRALIEDYYKIVK